MAGIANNPNSPRQKMINLMYLIFIAMMALNVSSEVLDGFDLVEDSLQKTRDNSAERNTMMMTEMSDYYKDNPVKAEKWYLYGKEIKEASDQVANYIDELKLKIVQKADGKKGDLNEIKHKDDLEAASTVMLAPVVGEGKKLKQHLNNYRELVEKVITDKEQKALLSSMLSTETPSKSRLTFTSWESALFENMPVAAAITLLTKMQSDIRYVEGEVLTTLVNSVDMSDYRMNKVEALVIPKSQIVMSGSPYEAQIVIAAVDSTKEPQIFLGKSEVAEKSNMISIGTGGTGEREISGYVLIPGETRKYDFSTKYFVTEQVATIAPSLMNVLYEGIENEVQIAMPGVPNDKVSATTKGGGTIRHLQTNLWSIKPNANTSKLEVVVTAQVVGGHPISREFKVRPLPDPKPYILYKDANGNTRKFTGGSISKRSLVEANGIQAAIDDGILDINFPVTSFSLTFFDSMGNAMPEVSQSGAFSQRQKDQIRNLTRGKRFYITNVKAQDPTGKSRDIATIEVIVN